MAEVRASADLKPGDVGEFSLANPDDPTSMQMVYVWGPESGKRVDPVSKADIRSRDRTTVYASRRLDGALAVAICTRDLGHAGEYGFAYLENNELEVPGGMFMYEPESKVEEHWYRVLNNLR